MPDPKSETVHVLKTHALYYDAVERGDKTFEIRRNDRGFQKGDLLHLVRVAADAFKPCVDITCTRCKPTFLTKRITFVFGGDPGLRDLGGIAPGYVVLGLGDVRTPPGQRGDA